MGIYFLFQDQCIILLAAGEHGAAMEQEEAHQGTQAQSCYGKHEYQCDFKLLHKNPPYLIVAPQAENESSDGLHTASHQKENPGYFPMEGCEADDKIECYG